MKKVYIAGPITGVEGYKDRFERAEEILLEAGYQPASPIAQGLVEGYTYRDYINRGLRILEECDAICLFRAGQGAAGRSWRSGTPKQCRSRCCSSTANTRQSEVR